MISRIRNSSGFSSVCCFWRRIACSIQRRLSIMLEKKPVETILIPSLQYSTYFLGYRGSAGISFLVSSSPCLGLVRETTAPSMSVPDNRSYMNHLATREQKTRDRRIYTPLRTISRISGRLRVLGHSRQHSPTYYQKLSRPCNFIFIHIFSCTLTVSSHCD